LLISKSKIKTCIEKLAFVMSIIISYCATKMFFLKLKTGSKSASVQLKFVTVVTVGLSYNYTDRHMTGATKMQDLN